MNLRRVEDFVNDRPTFVWINGIIQFLASVFGNEIPHAQAIALMQVLTRFSIKLRDGTVINEPDNLNRGIWLADAGAIVSALCVSPDKDPVWWKWEFSSFNKETAEYDNLVAVTVQRIRNFPQVSAIEDLW